MSDNRAKFEEMWKSCEHQVDVCENLSSSKLDDDVKISVVLREDPFFFLSSLSHYDTESKSKHRPETNTERDKKSVQQARKRVSIHTCVRTSHATNRNTNNTEPGQDTTSIRHSRKYEGSRQ